MADSKQSRGLGEGYGKVVEGAPDIVPVKSSKDIGALSVKIDVDVTEALTGLKAVTREAKTAQKALRELEVTVAKTDGELIASITQDDAIVRNGYSVDFGGNVLVGLLSAFSTKMLAEELAKRNSEELTELLTKITDDNQHDEI